jgi:WASH complex subunit CCDC53
MNNSTLKPVPIHFTLLLVNNFLINTTNFLNQFSETVEKKISGVSSRVTELEILLAVLEAKLNSIPGLEFSSGDLPPTAPAASSAPAAPPSATAPTAPAPASAPAAAAPAPAAAPVETKPAGILAKDHPGYAPFFKMLRVGVPLPVVAGKVTAAGLDASLLDNPDAIIPEGSDGAGSSALVVAPPPPAPPQAAPPPPTPPPAAVPPAPAQKPPAPAEAAPAPAAEEENPAFAVYSRMRRMLPEPAVRHKMKNDGLSEAEIDAFFAS